MSASFISPRYSTVLPSICGSTVLAKVRPVVVADLGGHLQFHSAAAGDFDGAVGTLVARQPSEKREIGFVRAPLPVRERHITVERQAMIDVADPIRMRQRPPLALRYGNHRKARPAAVGAAEIAVVQPPVRSRYRSFGHMLEHRKMQEMAEMEVDDVEILGAQAHFVQHRKMRRDRRFQRRRIEPERLVADGHKAGVRHGVPARKEGNVMAIRHQSVDQIGDDPFGAAIKPGGNGFIQGRDVGNSHGSAYQPVIPECARHVDCSNQCADPGVSGAKTGQCGRDAFFGLPSTVLASISASECASP